MTTSLFVFACLTYLVYRFYKTREKKYLLTPLLVASYYTHFWPLFLPVTYSLGFASFAAAFFMFFTRDRKTKDSLAFQYSFLLFLFGAIWLGSAIFPAFGNTLLGASKA